MLLEVLKQGWQMAKIDLNDGYRMIPLARDHYQLPSFQIRQRERVQFQCLPFRFCTTPFVFMKVTKPVVQFLRHLRIHLIIYLDDLLLAAPTVTRYVNSYAAVHCSGISSQLSPEYNAPHPEVVVPGLYGRHKH